MLRSEHVHLYPFLRIDVKAFLDLLWLILTFNKVVLMVILLLAGITDQATVI